MPESNVTDPSVQTSPDDFAAFEKWRNDPDAEVETTEKETPAVEPETATAKTTPSESEPELEQENIEHGTKGKGFQKRIDKLTARIRDLEARKPAGDETKPGVASPQQTATAEAPKDARPQAEDFDSYEEYIEKLTDFKIDQREGAARATEAKHAAGRDWQAKIDAVSEALPDFKEVLEAAEMELSPAMQEAIVTSEHGAEIAYHLATHPDDADRIAKLSPVAAVRELGRLEAQFTSPETHTKVTSAPRPPATVSGRHPSAKRIDDPDLPFAEFERMRNAQLKKG